MPFIYQADCWCDSCGEAIKERLLATATDEEKQNWEDERNYDSGEFPKSMGDDEESDSPQHCASLDECLEAEELLSGQKIGCLLSTNLTNDGVTYVKEAVAEGGEVAEFWKERFDWIDFPKDEDDEHEA